MSGLDNILSRLDKECSLACEEIIADAVSAAEKRKNEAEIKAVFFMNEKTEAAKKEAQLLIQKAHSSAAANERRILLSAKVELIEDILSKTLHKLHNLDTPSYFTVLKKLAEKNALEGKGIMYLSERDLNRMPSDFSSSLKEIEISSEPYNISDGFILKYGDIEVNCTFSAMLNSSKEELKAVAGEMLFGQ
ncbi:MAG: V-type ATP synthase subunit E [Clostridia bacterium]|nr:V-type ATP synthase subunit E [Clostridia bacterium]